MESEAFTMRRSSGDEAVSPLLGFIVAIAVYVMALAAFVSFASAPPTTSSTVDADLQNRAGTALDLLLTDSGATGVAGDWVSDPDAMLRFGLVDGTSNFIDYDKIKLLRKGKIDKDGANGYPDYPEAKTALGLDDHQFHVRTYPVLVSVDDANWEKMRGQRVAYLADATDPTASADITSTVVNGASGEKIYRITITNTNANPMIFTVSADIDVTNNKDVSTTRQTRLLTQGQQDVIDLAVWPMKRWDDEPLQITFATSDNYGVCACENEVLSATPTEGNAYAYEYHYLADTDASYYRTGETVTIKVDHFDRSADKKEGIPAQIRVYKPDGHGSTSQLLTPEENVHCKPGDATSSCPTQDPPPAGNPDYMLPWQKNQRWEFTCACATLEGLWKVVVNPPGDTSRTTTMYYWVDDDKLFSTPALDPVAAKEVQYIFDLVEGFDTSTYTATDANGDPDGHVFVDTNQDVRKLVPFIDDNPPTCDDPDRRFDMLIVGSNAAHHALVKLKDDVARFVDCGGTLVALGSSRSGTEWLQEVYNIALENGAGGGISSPDPTHPLLNVPEKLSWNTYDDTGYAWDVSQSNVIWSHAVDGDTADHLVLGVTDQGALEGSVVLTGWTPGELTSPQDDMEAKRLLHNLMSQGYQMLFLDYGPEIPDGVPVGSSSRLAVVPYEELDEVPYVEVKIVLYVWRG